MPSQPIRYIEFSAGDRLQLACFYRDLFGWEFQDMPEVNYTTFSAGEAHPAGGFEIDPKMCPPGLIIPYFHTDDIDQTLRQVETLGGQVMIPKSKVPGVGWIAHFLDPSGNRVALLQPDQQV